MATDGPKHRKIRRRKQANIARADADFKVWKNRLEPDTALEEIGRKVTDWVKRGAVPTKDKKR